MYSGYSVIEKGSRELKYISHQQKSSLSFKYDPSSVVSPCVEGVAVSRVAEYITLSGSSRVSG